MAPRTKTPPAPATPDPATPDPRERATQDQLAERHAYALQLSQLGVPPTIALQRISSRCGGSVRQSRRYLAHANEEVRQEGIPSESELIDVALGMTTRVLANAILDAAESGEHTQLYRLSRELRELKSATRPGPQLSDDELKTEMRIQAAKDAYEAAKNHAELVELSDED